MRRTLALFLVAFMALGTGLVFAAGQRTEREDRVNQVDRERRVTREGQVDRDGRNGLTGNLYRISEIESFDIINQGDEKIGNVEDVVLSLEGSVTHLIVDLRATEGVEDGKYLVPVNSIQINDNKNVTLDLRRAQQFRSDDDSADQRARQLPEGSVRSSDFRGYNVIGPRDNRIANIDDVVVDIATGQVVYVVITSGGFLGIGNEHYAVAFHRMQVVAADEQVRLALTEDDLSNMEGFDTNNWPAQAQAITTGEIARNGLLGSLYRVSEIGNFGVMSGTDERLGDVSEVVLNLDGKVTHLIAYLYNPDGLAGGAYLIPMDAVSLYDTENIRVDARQAQRFARFDGGYDAHGGTPQGVTSQPSISGPVPSAETGIRQDTVYEREMAHNDRDMVRGQQLPAGTVRSSEFLRYDVVGPRDNVVASIEDLVVNVETGEVVYVAIGSGGFLGIGRNHYAISFDHMQVNVAEAQVRINMTEEDLAQLEGFDLGNWPYRVNGRQVSATQ